MYSDRNHMSSEPEAQVQQMVREFFTPSQQSKRCPLTQIKLSFLESYRPNFWRPCIWLMRRCCSLAPPPGPPVPIILNILRIWAYCLRRLLTSWMEVPEPAAMRLRRLPLMSSWSRRSRLVIELMMDSTRVSWPSSDLLGGLGHAGEGADGGEHLHDGFHGAHFFDLPELFAEVFEGKAVAGEGFFGELLGLAAVEFFFGAFEQGGDIAHAHDAGGDAVGVEGLEGRRVFRRCRGT